MKKHGLRGSFLENIVNRTITDYRNKKLALIQKIPTPITVTKLDKGRISCGFFDKKSTVDYIGVVQEIPVCFDAKEVDNDTFPIKNIHKHQYEFMEEWENQGGLSFLLIYFKTIDKLYYMRFAELTRLYNRTKKSFNVKELDKNYFFKIGLKSDFLPKMQLDIDER